MPNQPTSGLLLAVLYKPEGIESRPADRYARVPLTEALLRAGRGIDGDRKGGRGDRQINLTSAENLAFLHDQGFRTDPGEMGEQMVVRGIDLTALKGGDRLYIGATACLEVINQRTGCLRLQQVQGRPLKGTANRLGVIAKATADGVVRVGDPVRVEPAAVTPARR